MCCCSCTKLLTKIYCSNSLLYISTMKYSEKWFSHVCVCMCVYACVLIYPTQSNVCTNVQHSDMVIGNIFVWKLCSNLYETIIYMCMQLQVCCVCTCVYNYVCACMYSMYICVYACTCVHMALSLITPMFLISLNFFRITSLQNIVISGVQGLLMFMGSKFW